MNKIKLKEIIFNALSELKASDTYVIQKRAHEIAINHRFAVYLENYLGESAREYFVDIEYNKNGDGPKISGGEKIRPDIIVHKRSDGNTNLLFVEAKKRRKFESNQRDNHKIEGAFDTPLNYQYALYVQYRGPREKIIAHFVSKSNGEFQSEKMVIE